MVLALRSLGFGDLNHFESAAAFRLEWCGWRSQKHFNFRFVPETCICEALDFAKAVAYYFPMNCSNFSSNYNTFNHSTSIACRCRVPENGFIEINTMSLCVESLKNKNVSKMSQENLYHLGHGRSGADENNNSYQEVCQSILNLSI